MPVCGKCREDKPPEQFSKCRSLPSGLQNRCKACDRVYAARRTFTSEQTAARKIAQKKWRNKNVCYRPPSRDTPEYKAARKECNRAYRELHLKELREYDRARNGTPERRARDVDRNKTSERKTQMKKSNRAYHQRKWDKNDPIAIRAMDGRLFTEEDGLIYFAYTPDGRWKIGWTTNLVGRLKEASTWCSYEPEVRGTCFGNVKAERAIHRLLEKHRISPIKEWFYDCEDVRNLVSRFCCSPQVDAAAE